MTHDLNCRNEFSLQMDNEQRNVIPISKVALDFILLMCGKLGYGCLNSGSSSYSTKFHFKSSKINELATYALYLRGICWICNGIDLCVSVGFPILFLFLWGDPYHRGFFCNDESLRHPYINSTVPSIYLYIVGMGLNCLVVSNFLINFISN